MHFVGINLGNRFSRLSVLSNTDDVDWKAWRFGNLSIASSIAIDEDNSRFVGDEAHERIETYQLPGIDDFKLAHLQRQNPEAEMILRKFKATAFGEEINLDQEHLSSLLIRELVRKSELEFSVSVSSAVLTVPSEFSFFQRKSLELAAKLAGLEGFTVINELSAVSMQYFLRETGNDNKGNLIVIDVGKLGTRIQVSVKDSAKISVVGNYTSASCGTLCLDEALAKYRREEANVAHNEEDTSICDLKCAFQFCTCDSNQEKLQHIFGPVIEILKLFITESVNCAGIDTRSETVVTLIGGGSKIKMVEDAVIETLKIRPQNSENSEFTVVDAASTVCSLLQGHISFPENVTFEDRLEEQIFADIKEPGQEQTTKTVFQKGSPMPSTFTLDLDDIRPLLITVRHGGTEYGISYEENYEIKGSENQLEVRSKRGRKMHVLFGVHDNFVRIGDISISKNGKSEENVKPVLIDSGNETERLERRVNDIEGKFEQFAKDNEERENVGNFTELWSRVVNFITILLLTVWYMIRACVDLFLLPLQCAIFVLQKPKVNLGTPWRRLGEFELVRNVVIYVSEIVFASSIMYVAIVLCKFVASTFFNVFERVVL